MGSMHGFMSFFISWGTSLVILVIQFQLQLSTQGSRNLIYDTVVLCVIRPGRNCITIISVSYSITTWLVYNLSITFDGYHMLCNDWCGWVTVGVTNYNPTQDNSLIDMWPKSSWVTCWLTLFFQMSSADCRLGALNFFLVGMCHAGFQKEGYRERVFLEK